MLILTPFLALTQSFPKFKNVIQFFISFDNLFENPLIPDKKTENGLIVAYL